MQLFNQINVRKIGGEGEVWEGLLDNKLFLGILGGEIVLQVRNWKEKEGNWRGELGCGWVT